MDGVLKFIATLGGVGKLPRMPGTAGSAVTALLLWFFAPVSGANLLMWALAISLLGMAVCYMIDRRKLYGAEDDPQEIVIDEAAGVLLSVIGHGDPQGILLGFLLFRLFDIRKPLGIKRLEHAPRGQGIMLDDLAAGALANLCATTFIWSITWLVSTLVGS